MPRASAARQRAGGDNTAPPAASTEHVSAAAAEATSVVVPHLPSSQLLPAKRTRRAAAGDATGGASSAVPAAAATRAAIAAPATPPTALAPHTGPARSTALLLELPGLVRATVVRRPSARNRSPYVADVRLEGREAESLVHTPGLDLGGKCLPGAVVLLKTATARDGTPVGPDAISPKHGTPKCEFIMQLCALPAGGWVAGHPSLGERLATALLSSGRVAGLPPVASLQREVSGICGSDMRTDFVLTHHDGSRTVLEVKTVVDADSDVGMGKPQRKAKKKKRGEEAEGEATAAEDAAAAEGAPAAAAKGAPCAADAGGAGLSRPSTCAIFPWGGGNQKGPDGEKCVSARAIKHCDELALIAKGDKLEAGGERLSAAILFMVVRGDAMAFKPNETGCPSFCRHLRAAAQAGVTVLAERVSWGTGLEEGRAYADGPLPVLLD